MKEEIKSAVDFLSNILSSRDDINSTKGKQFNTVLRNLLSARYQDHWFPEKPFKGSGYRCIRLNHNMDPLILEAGRICGLNHAFLESTFPPELTIWVDPMDVSFRIGENGSVGILYQSEPEDIQSVSQSSQQETFTHSPIHQGSHHFSSTFMSCKDQFMSALPSLSSDSLHYKQFAGFVSS